MQSLFGRMVAGAGLAAAAASAHASFLSGEVLDTAADILAIVVLVLVLPQRPGEHPKAERA
jgi:branched-subunit amino acid ABC-type transport system permease component